MTEPADQYLHRATFPLELGGSTFMADLHLGLVGGRTVCIGLGLHSFEVVPTGEHDGSFQIRDLPSGLAELTARKLRGLRLEELTEAVRQDMLDDLDQQIGSALSEDVSDWLEWTRKLYEHSAREGRPGRPAHLPDEVLATVVAGAYERHVRAGGGAPVVAVQKELQRALDAGELADTKFGGGGPSGEVTIHQARALVRRARSLDLLPSTPRGTRRDDQK